MRTTRTRWFGSALQDLRYGVVLLRRDAGVSALMVLVLALGIGGNAAIFTLLKAAFLDPLPYRDAARLVTIKENSYGWNPSTSGFLEIRARTRTIEHIAFAEHTDMQLTGAGDPARIYAARITPSFLPLLGARPTVGRLLVDEDNRPGRPPAVVLSDAFWKTRMGADPGVVGRTVRLDAYPATVVGVLPPGFHFDYPSLGIADPVDLYVSYPLESWLPLHMSVNGSISVRVLGRLRPAVTLAQAQTELREIAEALKHEHPEAFPTPRHEPSRFSYEVQPLREAIVGTQRSLLWLLLGGVTVLLLIACSNTAQLLLARSLRRTREVAIRSALGAGGLRLVQQFLLEGLVLAVAGGVTGLAMAGWTARILVRLLPVRSPLLASAHRDSRVVAFTLGVSVVSALLFAMLPAIKGSRWAPGPSIGARAGAGERNHWRHAMIAVEAALSAFLLCGAALVGQNLWTLIATPMGFDPNHVLAMKLRLPLGKQDQPEAKAGAMFGEYLRKIEAIPGVDSAATVTGPPLRPARGGNAQLAGVTDGAGNLKGIMAWSHQISPDYFRTLRIPLLAGRAFREDDAGARIGVVIVNQEFARRFGLGADIVGRQLAEMDGSICCTIVGLVGNVRTRGRDTVPFPEGYVSNLQFSWPNAYLLVRSALPAAQLLRQVKNAIGSENSDQAVFGVQTMDELISDAVTEPRFNAFLTCAFALLAMVMTAAGMYSVIACLVSQRTSEIAIRVALGASRGDIVRTVLGATTLWMAAGLACGLALGVATRNTIRALSSTAVTGSPWTYAAVPLFFFLVTLMAAWAPMRRASRLDPAAALRCE